MVRRTRGRLPSKAAKGTTQRNVSKGTTAVQSKAHRRSGEGQGTTTQRRKTTDSRGLEPIPKAIAGRAPARQRFLRSRVLITGGAEGIGRGIALAFAAEGADVFVADIKAPSGADRKCEKGLAGSIRYFSCDAGVPEQVSPMQLMATPMKTNSNPELGLWVIDIRTKRMKTHGGSKVKFQKLMPSSGRYLSIPKAETILRRCFHTARAQRAHQLLRYLSREHP